MYTSVRVSFRVLVNCKGRGVEIMYSRIVEVGGTTSM